MAKIFNVYNTQIEISDEALTLFRKTMGFELTESLVRHRIGIVYGSNPFTGYEGQSAEEAVKTHSAKEIGQTVSEAFIKEMQNDYQ